jgi:3-isopropylmalate/(R)-2-methylmalate dehydratase small subunit
MNPFTRVSGIGAVLARENIDTGAIIPSRYMRSPDQDLGEGLFGDWRYDSEGAPKADFILNRPPFDKSRFIVAGDNFGCGSSREAAVWALCEFGIRAVVSTAFGDIFYENAFKNGLLPIIVSPEELKQLMATLSRTPAAELTVDLQERKITSTDLEIPFQISPTRQSALILGLDEIGVTLGHLDSITAFRNSDRQERPWIYR